MARKSRTAASSGLRALPLVVMLGVLSLLSITRHAQARQADDRVMAAALVIERVGTGGRTLIQTDGVDALRVAGEWKTPAAGDAVAVGDETRKWEERTVGEDGWMRVRAGGYVSWAFDSPAETIMILEASGHTVAFVNGEPRTGDPYEYGYVRLPVLVKKGANEILLKSGRGRVRAKLAAPRAGVFFNDADLTMPDLLLAEGDKNVAGGFGAIIVVNATRDPLVGATIRTTVEGAPATSEVPVIPPLSVRKVRIDLAAHASVRPVEAVCKATLESASGPAARMGDRATFKLNVRRPTEKHKRTFISGIDGSVQYYAVVPPPEGTDLSEPKALILSLHGASVEATNQANCYKQRAWCYVICPTNRRPFGFDWEDWGRTDALEVLGGAYGRFETDRARTYLTGHSMGGHGTWNIGVQFPGTFAALGPSAGWISFWSYAGGAPREGASPVEEILIRAAGTSDTLAMKQNFTSQGIYILHGDADDNVPVAQARTMREELGAFHPDFAYYEEPGAGHWWGDQCVDWDPMIEFFKGHALDDQKEVRRVDFTTVNPAVSSGRDGVSIDDQVRPLMPSRIQGELDSGKGRYVLHTENVRGFRVYPGMVGRHESPPTFEIDGEMLKVDGANSSKGHDGWWHFSRASGSWKEGVDISSGSTRANLFKSAFDNRVVLVYATGGTQEENAASFAKARYDAESFWYRGNGDFAVMSDAAYVADRVVVGEVDQTAFLPSIYANVILYGNADTNLAWSTVLEEGASERIETGVARHGALPIVIRKGVIKAGAREVRGEDLACLFVAPMRDDRTALVGVVGSTGPAGARLADQLPYFVSGVGIPEFVILHPDLRTNGVAGIRAAGFFGKDWTHTGPDAVWAE